MHRRLSLVACALALLLAALAVAPVAAAAPLPAVVGTVPVGGNPAGVAVDASTGRAYVASTDANKITILQETTVVGTISDSRFREPTAVAVNPQTSQLFAIAVDPNGKDVLVVVTLRANRGEVARIVPLEPTLNDPFRLAMDVQRNLLYILTNGDDPNAPDATVFTCVASNSVVAAYEPQRNRLGTPIQVGCEPSDLVVDPTTGHLFVARDDSPDSTPAVATSFITEVNPAEQRVVADTWRSTGLVGIGINPGTRELFVVNDDTGNASLAVLKIADGGGPLAPELFIALPTGSDGGPDFVAIDVHTDTAYVTNEGLDEVHVIDVATGTVTGTVPVGSEPKTIAIDPRNVGGPVYVVNNGGNSVTVLR